MDTKYEVSFQDPGTDQYFTCQHEHGSIKEAVACLYKVRPGIQAPILAIFALLDGQYRSLTRSEEARVRMATRSFII